MSAGRVLANLVGAGPGKNKRGVSGSVRPEEIRAALALDEETRTEAMVHFRRAGGDLDRWGPTAIGPTDARRMADALTYAEDRLEMRRSSSMREAARVAIRAVRRRLET